MKRVKINYVAPFFLREKFSHFQNFIYFFGNVEAITRSCSAKKVSLRILQNLQKKICVGVSFSTKL